MMMNTHQDATSQCYKAKILIEMRDEQEMRKFGKVNSRQDDLIEELHTETKKPIKREEA